MVCTCQSSSRMITIGILIVKLEFIYKKGVLRNRLPNDSDSDPYINVHIPRPALQEGVRVQTCLEDHGIY